MKNYRVNRFEILKYIKNKYNLIMINDVTNEFEYDDIYIYDCKMDTKFIQVGIHSENNFVFSKFSDFDFFQEDVEEIIEDLVSNIENDLKNSFNIEPFYMDYKVYTFFDYKYSINFTMFIDFTNDVEGLKNIKEDVINLQIQGKSKYLI